MQQGFATRIDRLVLVLFVVFTAFVAIWLVMKVASLPTPDAGSLPHTPYGKQLLGQEWAYRNTRLRGFFVNAAIAEAIGVVVYAAAWAASPFIRRRLGA